VAIYIFDVSMFFSEWIGHHLIFRELTFIKIFSSFLEIINFIFPIIGQVIFHLILLSDSPNISILFTAFLVLGIFFCYEGLVMVFKESVVCWDVLVGCILTHESSSILVYSG
jgi:hypothetical protein